MFLWNANYMYLCFAACPLDRPGGEGLVARLYGNCECSYYMYVLIEKETNTNLHSSVKIEAEFSSLHALYKNGFVPVQVKDSKYVAKT